MFHAGIRGKCLRYYSRILPGGQRQCRSLIAGHPHTDNRSELLATSPTIYLRKHLTVNLSRFTATKPRLSFADIDPLPFEAQCRICYG